MNNIISDRNIHVCLIMIDYWHELALPAWESQTQVKYQLDVKTSMGVPTVSVGANWYERGDAQHGSPNPMD